LAEGPLFDCAFVFPGSCFCLRNAYPPALLRPGELYRESGRLEFTVFLWSGRL